MVLYIYGILKDLNIKYTLDNLQQHHCDMSNKYFRTLT
jgi:hypothetical protein